MKFTVLLVDDDYDERVLFRAALEESGLDVDLQEVSNGAAAMNYLPPPDLLFLDLKMPSMDGFEVLKQVRARPGLKYVPIIIFTNSAMDQDMNRVHSLGADAFQTKPSTYKALVNLLPEMITPWRHPRTSGCSACL